jgi:hypothetical protein
MLVYRTCTKRTSNVWLVEAVFRAQPLRRYLLGIFANLSLPAIQTCLRAPGAAATRSRPASPGALASVAREACRSTGGATTPRHRSWKASIFCLGILERPLLTAHGRRSGFRRPAGLTTDQAQDAIIGLRRDHLSGPAIARRLRHVSGMGCMGCCRGEAASLRPWFHYISRSARSNPRSSRHTDFHPLSGMISPNRVMLAA